MHFFQYASLLLTASALETSLQPRTDCEDTQDDQLVYNDGPTTDRTAGIGAEFESPFFRLINRACNGEDTDAAKKSVIDGRRGTNWELTADSTGSPGRLNAEYILDGRNIKVGSDDGWKAGKELAENLISWKPWKNDPKTLNIENNKCNPWTIDMNSNTVAENLPWFPQVTTPMPLEALYSLMKEHVSDEINRNPLDGTNDRFADKFVLVDQNYFQSRPNGIDQTKMTDDVLAFCSLILTYAKSAADSLRPNQSPKLYSSFMPRTEFNTIFELVKPKLPGDLFNIFNTLACYTKEGNNLVIDTAYCTGTLANPVLGDKFSGLEYTNTAPQPAVSVNIKEWIQGIGKQDPSPDLLSKFDASIDGSIGGLGTNMEKMFQSDRAAPLMEFRDLYDKRTIEIEQFMRDVNAAVQKLHKDFANAPTKRKRDVSDCSLPEPTSSVSSGGYLPAAAVPPAVIPVDPPSQPSCVPSPTGKIRDAHEYQLKNAAGYFCVKHATDTNAQAPINIQATIGTSVRAISRNTVGIAYEYSNDMMTQDDVYDFSITSVDRCTPLNGFNLPSPVANTNCQDILYNAWKNCNNKGRGGQITAGCLIYSVKTKF